VGSNIRVLWAPVATSASRSLSCGWSLGIVEALAALEALEALEALGSLGD